MTTHDDRGSGRGRGGNSGGGGSGATQAVAALTGGA